MRHLLRLIDSDRCFWPALLLLTLVLRGPTLFVELYNIDEAFYAAAARSWLAGLPPYVGFADMKPLLLFAYYRSIFAVFGDDMRAVHGVTLLWVLATTWALYRAGLVLHGRRAAGCAAFLYAFFPASFMGVDALAANSEILLNLPAALALWAFAWAVVREQPGGFLLAGAATGAAALFNFKGGAGLAAFVAVPLWLGSRGAWTWRVARQAAGSVAIGFAVPLALVYAYLYGRGVLGEALYWNFAINRQYIRAGVSFQGFLDSLANSLLIFVVLHLLLLVLAGRRARRLAAGEGSPAELAAAAVLLATAGAVCLGGRLYGHYLQQLYPALCLLAAPELARWLEGRASAEAGQHPRWVAAGFLVPLIVFGLLNYWDYVFRATPHVVLNDADLRSERVGRELARLTPPGETVFVWGFSPSIYYHSHRVPASRFVFVGPLVGETPGGRLWSAAEKAAAGQPRLWANLIGDLEHARPLWVLDTTPNKGFGASWGQHPMAAIPPLAAWVSDRYRKSGQIEEFDLWRREATGR